MNSGVLRGLERRVGYVGGKDGGEKKKKRIWKEEFHISQFKKTIYKSDEVSPWLPLEAPADLRYPEIRVSEHRQWIDGWKN